MPSPSIPPALPASDNPFLSLPLEWWLVSLWPWWLLRGGAPHPMRDWANKASQRLQSLDEKTCKYTSACVMCFLGFVVWNSPDPDHAHHMGLICRFVLTCKYLPYDFSLVQQKQAFFRPLLSLITTNQIKRIAYEYDCGR